MDAVMSLSNEADKLEQTDKRPVQLIQIIANLADVFDSESVFTRLATVDSGNWDPAHNLSDEVITIIKKMYKERCDR